MIPEFSRPLRVDGLPPGGAEQAVEATAAECAALAKRLQIPSLESLACRYRLVPGPGGRLAAAGLLTAQLTRTCVVTLDDFPARVDEPFDIVFVPAELASENDDPDEPDEIPYDGGLIDLGEAAVEQLALALEPYPRKPGAELPEGAQEDAASPFAALARLKRPN